MAESLSNPGNVKSLAVATRILDVLADAGRARRVTDLADQLSMTKARVSRHLTTLAGLGLVAKAEDKTGYRLGPKLFWLAQRAIEQFEITIVAYPFMVEFRDRTREALLLAIPAGSDAMVVSTLLSLKTVSPHLSRGTRLRIPVSPTARLVLAYSRESRVEDGLAQMATAGSETTDGIREQLATIRERFYDWDDDPHNAGFSVIAAPVFNHSEELEAALTVVMQRSQDRHGPDPEILSDLMRTSADVSQTIGSVTMVQTLLDSIPEASPA